MISPLKLYSQVVIKQSGGNARTTSNGKHKSSNTARALVVRIVQNAKHESEYGYYRKTAEQNDDLGMTIELLKKARDIEKRRTKKRILYTKKLIELCRKTNRQEQYKDELQELLFYCKGLEILYVEQLKVVTPKATWENVFRALLDCTDNVQRRWSLLYADGQYRSLLSEIACNGHLSDLLIYEETLRNWEPRLTMTVLVEMLKGEMDQSRNRKMYLQTIAQLKRLEGYRDGAEAKRNWYNSGMRSILAEPP